MITLYKRSSNGKPLVWRAWIETNIEFEGKDRFHSFKDINCLSTWDVFNGENFDSTFRDCKELSDIKALKYWDVSNGINFINMFCGCSSLADLSPLKNWKVSNSKNFIWMFMYVVLFIRRLITIKKLGCF